MPINNSYSQTSKRIFTNKPFIKGMNYTNADLEPYVCRAVANLELESSNSATKLRAGVSNVAIGTTGEYALRFYNKYIIFSRFVNEKLYKFNGFISDNNVPSDDIGIKVLNDNNTYCEIYPKIITNNTVLNWDGDSLNTSGEATISISQLHTRIYTLKTNENNIPHCVNGEDYSFSFFGIIVNNDAPVYRGLIKIYFHASAKQILIETITPEVMNYDIVRMYGLNVISKSPNLYRDWIKYDEHDYYADYFGDPKNDSKPVAYMTTAAIYEFPYSSPVNHDAYLKSNAYTYNYSAKMLKGIDATENGYFVIRPFYVLPDKPYGVYLTAKDKNDNDVIYNFIDHKFNKLTSFETVDKYKENTTFSIGTDLSDSDIYDYTFTIPTQSVECDIPTQNIKYEYDAFKVLELNKPFTKTSLSDINSRFNVNVTDSYPNADLVIQPQSYTALTINEHSILAGTGNVAYDNDADITITYDNTSTSKTYFYKTYSNLNQSKGKFIDHHSSQVFNYSPGGKFITKSTNGFNYYIDTNSTDNTITILAIHESSITIYSDRQLYDSYIDASALNFDEDHLFMNLKVNGHNLLYPSTDFTTNISKSSSGNAYTVTFTLTAKFTYSASYNDIVYILNDYGPSHLCSDVNEYGSYTNYICITDALYKDSDMTPSNTIYSDTATNDGIQPNLEMSNDALIELYISVNTSNLSRHILLQTTNDIDTTLFNADVETSNEVSETSYTLISDLNAYIETDDSRSLIHKVFGKLTYNGQIYDSLASFPNNINDILEITSNGSYDNVSLNLKYELKRTYKEILGCYMHDLKNTTYRHLSLIVYKPAFMNIDTSTVKINLIPLIVGDTTGDMTYVFKESSVKYVMCYSFRTDANEVVDLSEFTDNPLMSNPLGICNHIGHTVVWGNPDNPNTLYYSEYGNPAYFPSNWMITLDNPIVYAYPHKGNLIVFTSDDVYMLFNGNVPAPAVNLDGSTSGSEVAFTQKLIQANTRLGKENINTVRSVGKDVFFINNNNKGYLLKSNKYVNDESDIYLVKVTSQIDDLLDNPYSYANERFNKWYKYPYLQRGTEIISDAVEPSEYINIGYVLHDYSDLVNNFEVYTDADCSVEQVIDGDTVDILFYATNETIRFRLADLDTPEVSHEPGGSNERLGAVAKKLADDLINGAAKLWIYDTGDVDNYKRHIAYIVTQDDEEIDDANLVNLNATMLYNGLANFFDEDHDISGTERLINQNAYRHAVQYSLGIFNEYAYSEQNYNHASANDVYIFDEDAGLMNVQLEKLWIANNYELYSYTTNSYIYIVQPIKLQKGKAITIIYKYSIDNKMWVTYDLLGYIKPTDIIADSSIVGFKILTTNDDKSTCPSVVSFTKNKYDTTNINYTVSNAGYNTVVSSNKTLTINAYFDSGNQSISLMNDKLFREIKLMLGSLPDDLLTLDYSIDLYVDGKLVIPNQLGDCGDHIHHRPINTHYKGRTENLEGFQKVTFFAPARGRIPRIVFSINCESDINVLEYAIVYMQLNAK